MLVEKVLLKTIKTNPNNPRTIKDFKYKKLVQSIKDFPEMLEVRPIVVDDDMVVLGGNMRLKACQDAGLTETYVIKFKNLTEEKKQEFVIKDNVGYGEWDWDIIHNDWSVDLLDDWGLDVIDMPAELDYSVLDGETNDEENDVDGALEDMKRGLRKAIQIEYEMEYYEEAFELVRYWREQGMNVGMFLLEKLKEEKNKTT